MKASFFWQLQDPLSSAPDASISVYGTRTSWRFPREGGIRLDSAGLHSVALDCSV